MMGLKKLLIFFQFTKVYKQIQKNINNKQKKRKTNYKESHQTNSCEQNPPTNKNI